MLRVNLQERSKPRELQEHEDEGHSLPGRWVNSHELRAGDCIITRSGTRALITEIRQRFDDAFPVSNLSIIGHHNYAVGEVGVLVHNITVCEETLKELRKLYANGKGKSPDELRELLRSKKNEKGERLYNEDEINDAMGKVLPQNNLTPEQIARRKFLQKANLGGELESAKNIFLFENKGLTVQEFISKHRKGGIKEVLPSEALDLTVEEALRLGKVGGVNVRKLILDLRDKFVK